MRPALFLIPMLMTAAELKIDHVTVGGADLKVMQAQLASIGIRSEYGGAHSNHATEMAIASFPDGSYLELIAIQPNADPKAVDAHYWKKYMQGNAGPCAWAVRTTDVAAEVSRLRSAGVEVTAPQRSGRQKPDGTRLEWETANVGAEPNGTFFPFIIRDFTPRENRAFVAGHPTTSDFRGVTRVIIVVRDLKAATARYRTAYALGAPIETTDTAFGAKLAVFEGSPVVLASPMGKSWAAERLEKFGEGPCAFVLGKGSSKSGWTVTWFDAAKLGWRLGWE
ncbi:MAG TPA: VOC family protein [Bryobacteraceae bacterium]|nr:VOC family protein [Bryobacteraceae bacterium]